MTVMSTVSRPQQLCSAPVDSADGFFNGVNPPPVWSPLSRCRLFPSVTVFSKDACRLMTRPRKDSFRFVVWGSTGVSGLPCSRTHLFASLVAQVFTELVSNTTFQMSHCVSCRPLQLSKFCIWTLLNSSQMVGKRLSRVDYCGGVVRAKETNEERGAPREQGPGAPMPLVGGEAGRTWRSRRPAEGAAV